MFERPLRARLQRKRAATASIIFLGALLTLSLDTMSARAHTDNDASASHQERCLATAIFFEARGESAQGQRAVAEVILARARTPGWPKTICGVVYQGAGRKTGCQFSFACDRKADAAHGEAWIAAKEVAADVLRSRDDPDAKLSDATYFHNTHVRPSWCRHMVRVGRIGAHVFYRPRVAKT